VPSAAAAKNRDKSRAAVSAPIRPSSTWRPARPGRICAGLHVEPVAAVGRHDPRAAFLRRPPADDLAETREAAARSPASGFRVPKDRVEILHPGKRRARLSSNLP
jgi:hypothetical protein